jgi:hypothetical protein
MIRAGKSRKEQAFGGGGGASNGLGARGEQPAAPRLRWVDHRSVVSECQHLHSPFPSPADVWGPSATLLSVGSEGGPLKLTVALRYVLCSQDPATGFCSEPVECSQLPHTLCVHSRSRALSAKLLHPYCNILCVSSQQRHVPPFSSVTGFTVHAPVRPYTLCFLSLSTIFLWDIF